MRHLILMSLVVMVSGILFAQEDQKLVVNEISICTSVVKAAPVGSSSTFMDTVGTVYCFTNLTSDRDTTAIVHVWYYNGEKMSSIDLTMKGKNWRTWSSKRIWPTWTGDWRVDVEDVNGDLIASKKFTIESTIEPTTTE